MTTARDEELALLFHEARTHGAWLDKPVDDATLHRIHDLVRMAPTGGNTHPLRVLFLRSAAQRERLKVGLAPLNVDKTMRAPVTAVLAYDTSYADNIPKLFPAQPERREQLLSRGPVEVERLALLNASIQVGYFILAARALGLDCGPMGGFSNAKIDAELFPDGKWKSVLIVNLGYGDASKLFPRLPRLDFDEACKIV